MDGSERFEQLIAFIGSQLPQPVDEEASSEGAILFTGGAPPEVMVRLSDQIVTVAEFAGRWGEDTFEIAPRRVGEVHWRRLSETALMNAVSALIKGAREARLSTYRACPHCGERFPPEEFGPAEVCARCADLG